MVDSKNLQTGVHYELSSIQNGNTKFKCHSFSSGTSYYQDHWPFYMHLQVPARLLAFLFSTSFSHCISLLLYPLSVSVLIVSVFSSFPESCQRLTCPKDFLGRISGPAECCRLKLPDEHLYFV